MRPGDWRRWTVAITGMNATPDNPGPGYAVARCLRESRAFEGRIVGCGYDVLDSGLYAQRVTDTGYLLPYPSAGEEVLLERLLALHAAEGFDVIIPCLDAELQSFIRLEPTLREHGIRMLLPELAAARARDKDRLSELCQKLGVNHPKTQKVTDPGFFERCLEQDWSYPMMVKGPFYDARLVRNPVEAEAAFRCLGQQWGYPILVQEFLAGQELNLTGLGDGTGRLLGTVMMAKRALTDKGKAWAGVSVVDQKLEAMASRLVEGLKWRGPLEVEAMRCQDGSLHLIEINPRFPAWIYLSHGVQRNLPLSLLRLLSGEQSGVFPAPMAGRMFIRYAEELVVDMDTFESLMMLGQRPKTTHHVA